MEAAHATPHVLALAKDSDRLARLEEANKLLEEIQKVRAALPAFCCCTSSCTPGTAYVGCKPHHVATLMCYFVGLSRLP